MRSHASVALALLLAVGGCAHGRAAGAVSFGGYDATGLASWYGEEAAGHRTASGDLFDPDALTVAHRSLPLGSYVAVTALDTGRTVVARVNDRGPGRLDRIVDLSRGTARALGTERRPVAAVRVRAVGYGVVGGSTRPTIAAPQPAVPASASGRYVVRVATFSNGARARSLADRLGADVVSIGALWRVRLGPFDADAAQRARDAVAARGYGDAQILPAE